MAKCNFWKNFKTFSADSWLARKKLESSAYCDSFMSIFLFGIFIPCIVESLFMFAVVTSPCTTNSGSDKG